MLWGDSDLSSIGDKQFQEMLVNRAMIVIRLNELHAKQAILNDIVMMVWVSHTLNCLMFKMHVAKYFSVHSKAACSYQVHSWMCIAIGYQCGSLTDSNTNADGNLMVYLYLIGTHGILLLYIVENLTVGS